jgi:hypothetical protein
MGEVLSFVRKERVLYPNGIDDLWPLKEFDMMSVFQVNDVVKCIIPMTLEDGVVHNKGDNITITKANVRHFNFYQNSYVLWHRG